MGFVDKTPEGRYRAYFRDPAGKQRSKSFRLKKDANAFLAEMETAKGRGAYVAPSAGRTRFGQHAEQWMTTWNVDATTAARDRSVMLQAWVTELGLPVVGRPELVAVDVDVASPLRRPSFATGRLVRGCGGTDCPYR